IIDKKLPATDEFMVEGHLTGSAKALSLLDAKANAKRGPMNVVINGEVKDLIAFSGVDLKVKGSGRDLAEVGPIIGEKLPATDDFAVQGRLMGSMKTLSLQEAMGRASRDGMNVTVDGEIMDVLALRSMNIRLKASGKELAAIGPLIGSNLPKVGPFDVRGHLIGSAKLLLLKDLSAIVDKSDFKGLMKIEFLKRPKITVRLESSVIDFTHFMRMAEKDKREFGVEEKRERRLFPEDPLPFDALKKVDADILMKARNIHAKDARLEFGHLNLKLQDGDFSIDRLEATYRQTKISGNLHINSSSTPQVATNFLVQNFDLGNLLKETGVNDQIRAVIDIAAHGKSKGDSVRSLMANLDGSIGAVMGEGYLTRYLNLLSVGLSSKVAHFWGKHKKGGEIRCAVVQFDIKNGIAASRAFVFDTEAGVLSGEGDINLGTEQVNFLLVPKPKHLSLSFSTKLRVSGSVMDPKVRPDTLSLLSKGARALSALVIGPLGLLAPFVSLGAHKAHPCNVHGVGK
ncbi:MAG: AsmA-like C-terminal region-containing protein, partial [Desulfobacterales bacterium]